jgi:hypothetical protein
MKGIAGLFLTLSIVTLLPLATSSIAAQSSSFVRAVPDCGAQDWQNGHLFVLNRCDINVSVTWSSGGDVWGSAHLGPAGSQNTGSSSEDVERAGGVDLFTCPGDSTPEDPEGRPVGAHYKGGYRCRR